MKSIISIALEENSGFLSVTAVCVFCAFVPVLLNYLEHPFSTNVLQSMLGVP